jgi:hypothetical protein
VVLGGTRLNLDSGLSGIARRLVARATHAESLAAFSVLALLTAALFAEVLGGGRVLYERDIHLLLYGQVETLVRIVAAGAWPVWDPYLAFGQPLLANPGAQVFYPWTWLNFVAQPADCYDFYVVSHHLLSALGMYWLARRLGLSRSGALIAATLWSASGPLLSFVSLWQHFAGAAWIPWVLLAADRALSEPRVGRVLAWGAAVALQVLAGSVEMAVVTAALSALVLSRHLISAPERAARSRRLAATVAAAVVALGLSAALWVPAVEMLGSTHRLDLTASVRTTWSLHPYALAQSLWPLVLNKMPPAEAVRRLYDGREPFLASIYLGLSALPLVAAAVTARDRLALALSGALVCGVALSLGRHFALYDLVVSLAPPLGMFRFPVKLMILPAFAWALLGGLGFDRLEALSPRQRGVVACLATAAVAVAVGAALVLLAAPEGVTRVLPEWNAGLVRSLGLGLLAAAACAATIVVLGTVGRLTAGAAVALLAIDLLGAHRGLNATIPRGQLDRRPVTADIVGTRGPARLFAFTYGTRVVGRTLRRPDIRDAFIASAAPPLSASERSAIGLQTYLPFSIPSRWGLSSSYGADVVDLGSQKLHNLELFLISTEETPGFLRLLRIASVSHVMAMHTEGLEDLALLATLDSPFRRQIRVFSVPDPLPRAYVVGRARVVDGFPAYQTLVDPGFDPRSEIMVPPESPVWGPALAAETPGVDGSAGSLRALTFSPDRVRASVAMARHGYFVLVDAWAPGWQASVDGVGVPVLRANVAFRAVPVPPGDHQVELVYRPPAIRRGLLVSASTLAAGVIALVVAGRARP